MTRYVAFLRAVNVGKRRVAMADARAALEDLGYADVASHVNSGNLIFTATGGAAALEKEIRAALEEMLGFECTTFVRTAAQVRALAEDDLFDPLADGHTHFVLFTLTKLTAEQKRAVEALSNDHDEVRVVGRDLHWLIRSSSIKTTLGPGKWKKALPGVTTTARNVTMLRKLVAKL